MKASGYLSTKFLGRYYLACLVHLVPFLLVNDVLTYLPIVWYDNDFNLGLITLSVPVEDSVYSILMLLLIISVYEGLRQRSIVKQYRQLAV
ncbi:lycopene cyclase domain-containing protein [Pontibacter harenae]|uniref:lycopene cyclase domain-containing protein n=1 Tax=Pontibacter harenae TaxID=2894083 RepID=UPI0034E1D298